MHSILLAPGIDSRATLSSELVQSERKLGFLLKSGVRQVLYLFLVMKKGAWCPRAAGNHFITMKGFSLGMELLY